jgi:putative ABC transport system permease protein
MAKVTFRGLFARKLRLFLTALAIALGVTLIAGTYVFTDTINASFDKIFQASNKRTDASITPREGVTTDQGTHSTLPASVLAKVRAHPDVAQAQGSVFDIATVFDAKGHKIGATGSPSFVGSVAELARFRTTATKDGRFPRTPSEAVIDAASAQREGVRPGDRIAVQGASRKTTYTVVGTVQIAGVDSFGGTTVVDLVLPEAQRVLGKTGRFDQIQAAAKPGVTPKKLATALRQSLPASVTVRTGQEQTAKDSRDIRNQLGFLTTALLAFAGISLFVGAFIIFNTFSITVTQRIREFALLRTLGASRGQVMRAVLGEGIVLGVLGSAIGLGLGLVTAIGLRALFSAIGVELPSSTTVIATRTIVVSLVVGTVVTLASSLAPALRATRVPPVEALREGAAPTAKGPSRVATVLAVLLTALGVGLMCLGLFGHNSETAALSFMGGGVAATFLGVALLSPYLVRPIASAIGRPIQRLAGITGRLARENTVRQPGRTAVTAAALMIGVALVTFASIFAAGARESIAKAVDQNLTAGLIVQNADGFSPFSAGALRETAQVPGVSQVSPVRFSRAEGRGPSKGLGTPSITGIDPATFRSLYEVKILKGGEAAVRALTTGRVAMAAKSFAESHNLEPGSRLLLRTPTNAVVPARISGVYDDKGGLLANLTFDNRQLAADFAETKDAFGLVGVQPGEQLQTVERRVKALLDRDYPSTEVLTAEQFKDQQAGQVNQLLGLIYALLSLAIIVSLFGIVNTLVLSITERTRELGMLRAIGMSRKQIKRMIRWEAVITSLIGGVLGAVLGTILAVLFTRPLDGFVLSIPVPTLIIMLILAGVAGVLAAVLPARRAARLNVLDALAYE